MGAMLRFGHVLSQEKELQVSPSVKVPAKEEGHDYSSAAHFHTARKLSEI